MKYKEVDVEMVQQKEKGKLPKIDKRVLCIPIICAAVILSVGVLWKYMPSDTDVYLNNEAGGRLVKEAAYDNDDSSLKYYIEYSYDEAGNLVKVISYDEDGNVLASNYAHEPEDYKYFGWREFSYDEAGNQVKYIEYDKYGVVVISEEYSYDEAGNLVWSIGYDKDGDVVRQREYSYDETGNLTKCVLSCENDGSGSWSEFSYDEAGNMIEIGEQYGNKYSFKNYQWEKRYDSSGNLVKETKLFDDGWGEETYNYDNSGNLVKKTCLEDDGYVNEETYSYDNSGNLVKETYQNYRDNEYINGNLYGITYSYDEAGNLVMKQEYDADGGILDSETHTYSYDGAGNLIKDACSAYFIIYTYE